jgi:bacteriocin-like protein
MKTLDDTELDAVSGGAPADSTTCWGVTLKFDTEIICLGWSF